MSVDSDNLCLCPTGLQDFVITETTPFGLGLNETILPQYLKPHGYSTHIVGRSRPLLTLTYKQRANIMANIAPQQLSVLPTLRFYS